MDTIPNKILVLGGAGYIGSQTCKFLSRNGFMPVVYDSLVAGHQRLVKWGPFHQGDVHDRARLMEVIKQEKPKAIIHFAAFLAAGESVVMPGKYYHNNVMGSLSVLEAMAECGIKHIIFSSTAAVYGIPEQIPITENAKTLPINPYGHSKLLVEEILQRYQIAYGIKSMALRYFNAAGADSEKETGSLQKQPTNLIPVLVNVQSGALDKLEIYGNDYDTPDGTAIRDYIHTEDLAEAHVLALQYLLAGGRSDICNLGTGQGYSVVEVMHAMEKASGKKVNYVYVPRRAGDPPILIANADKAKKLLGWNAKHNNIEFMVRTAWEWHAANSRKA